ncbi:spore cortex biosynthesis protein YabQ [Paenibacillus alvei]|uniref:spore cortex biosynthesis protein YabQ n=1 Tax=Paenibacillus alvei TaxID=44250 RepID=UPI0002F4C6AF|nr:spore cortex biosynthesis protein YabQ [Paenibacillus alvei]
MLMLMSGLALGLVFDSYRVVAGQFKFPRWTLPVFDLLYWLAATVFVFQMLVKGNQGELRFYVVLGLAAGAWLYAVFLSRITVAIVKWLVTALKAVWRFAMRCVHVLVVLPLKAILTGGKALTFFSYRLLCSFSKLCYNVYDRSGCSSHGYSSRLSCRYGTDSE